MSYIATLVKSMGLSGGEAIRTYDVSPDSSRGSITISDVTSAFVMGVVPLIEAPGALAQVSVKAKENATTTNQIDFNLYSSTNVEATGYKDFRVTVKVES